MKALKWTPLQSHILYFLGGVAASVGLVWVNSHFFIGPPHFPNTPGGKAGGGGLFYDLVRIPLDSIEKIQEKVELLKHSEEQNSRLKLENADLKLQLAQRSFAKVESEVQSQTQKISEKLTEKAGAGSGTLPSSIAYKVPNGLLPSQQYVLGVSYLKAGEVEKAALIFTEIARSDESRSYKTMQTLLLAGMSWYQLENYILANQYFDQILAATEEPSTLRYQAQARLWKALVANKLHQQTKVQYWLGELLDHHPHSEEVNWINSNGQKHEVSASQR